MFHEYKTMAQMKELDRIAIEERGIPSIWLMENASTAVVREIEKDIEQHLQGLSPEQITITVLCGPGNNGGDGFGIAWLLKKKGYCVRTYLAGKREKMTPDASKMELRFLATGGQTFDLLAPSKLAETYTQQAKEDIKNSHFLVDAMLGVGITREVSGLYAALITLVNRRMGGVYSCDIPSGLHGDTGEIMGVAVKADCTVTFSFPKYGMNLKEGPACCGRIVVADIGIPKD